MSLTCFGGLAALACAATHLVGFALLLIYLAPMGYGTTAIDPAAVVGFIHDNPAVMLAWNTTIYIVTALALAVRVVALRAVELGLGGGNEIAGSVWIFARALPVDWPGYCRGRPGGSGRRWGQAGWPRADPACAPARPGARALPEIDPCPRTS